ncbi:glycosyltransferase [bacterium]|nr:glycosyltransferase [FCB group bacterium]MBL7190332.1 glycosyltransferase [bacterium]
MKILYISPEHISGTLPLFCEGHRRKGNIARYVTLFPSRFGFPEDMQLKLRLHPDKSLIFNTRKYIRESRGEREGVELPGNPPFWRAGNIWELAFFKFRDTLNAPKVKRFFDENNIWDYDIFHLEQGTGFLRDCRFLLELKQRRKKFVCFYHGTDVRNRGVYPIVHEISDLNLTSEIDLLEKYPGIRYLFLPINTDLVKPIPRDNEIVKIAHAARSRLNKGTDRIIQAVENVSKKLPLEFILMENKPHPECMRIKSACDIYIDQIADKGGWGYGMSSVESLALGSVVCTHMNPKCENFLPDHPFVNVDENNLEDKLIKLIEDKDFREETVKKGREWVVKRHDIKSVMDALYNYYEEYGII